MSMACCCSCGCFIDTDNDPDSTYFDDRFICESCRESMSEADQPEHERVKNE